MAKASEGKDAPGAAARSRSETARARERALQPRKAAHALWISG